VPPDGWGDRRVPGTPRPSRRADWFLKLVSGDPRARVQAGQVAAALPVHCACAQGAATDLALSQFGPLWYQCWYHVSMAMTLRLADGETDALRRRAELEQRSMQEVARQAIREYIEGHSRAELLERVLDEELPRYAEALERLGQ
jgi:predicted transcriptional regulator